MLLFEAQSCRFPFFDGWKPASRAAPPAWWSGGSPELSSGAVTSIPQTPTNGNWCVQCDSTTDAEGWIYGSSWSALGWRGNGATGGWLAAPAQRNFGRYSCCASDTVRRRRWVFFPGPQVPVGHRVVAKRALVATHSADTEINDAETANEDTRADAYGGANANVAAIHICATREWGALVCAQPALPAQTVTKVEVEEEKDEEVHAGSVDGSCAPGKATLASHCPHDICTTSMPNAARSSSQVSLSTHTPPKHVPEEDEDEITSLFGNIDDDGDTCEIAQYRSLQQQHQAQQRQWAQGQTRSQLQWQASTMFAAADDNDGAPKDTDEFAYVHLRKTKPTVVTIPPLAPGRKAGVNISGCAGSEAKCSVYPPFNGIFQDNDDDDCEWVDVVAEVE